MSILAGACANTGGAAASATTSAMTFIREILLRPFAPFAPFIPPIVVSMRTFVSAAAVVMKYAHG